MNTTIATAISLLVMLNPFAMFVFLEPLRRNMERVHFNQMLIKASINSSLIFILFYLAGDLLFTRVFQIHFESFRIFGGIIIFSFAYLYIVQDRKTFIKEQQSINDLAVNVSIPFMVGPGTISLSILLANVTDHLWSGVLLIPGLMLLNYLFIILLGKTRTLFRRNERLFDNYMAITMRINIFVIGAIGIDMIIAGLRNLTTFF